MPRWRERALTTSSSLQKPFCTRIPPSFPPHCFWCPSALCSWCSSTTPSSVRSWPRRLRGGIRSPFLTLHPREVLVARKDALLDEQLDHGLQGGHRSALGLFHSAQDIHRGALGRSVGLGRRRRGDPGRRR